MTSGLEGGRRDNTTRQVIRGRRDGNGAAVRPDFIRGEAAVRTRQFDSKKKDLDLLAEGEVLRLLRAGVVRGEVQHGVGLPVGDGVQGDEGAQQQGQKDYATAA